MNDSLSFLRSVVFMDAALVVLMLLYVTAIGYYVAGLAHLLVDWLTYPIQSRSASVRRLQGNWAVFRYCSIHLHGGTAEYWQDWEFNYERIRNLSARYL